MTVPINVTKMLSPIYKGDDWAFSCVFTSKTTGLPLNLVTDGWTSWASQWRPYAKSETFFQLTIDSSQANVGRIIVHIPSSITSQITSKGVFDIEAIQNGVVRTWVRGDIAFEMDVTR